MTHCYNICHVQIVVNPSSTTQYGSGNISDDNINSHPGAIYGLSNFSEEQHFPQNHLLGQYFIKNHVFLRTEEDMVKACLIEIFLLLRKMFVLLEINTSIIFY